jgi:hypothetical protein
VSAPSTRITDAVDERDGYCCIRCGRSLERTSGSRHHRMRRRDGGHSPAQLVLLCGSGTTGCHGWAHANVAKAKALGLIIPAVRKPQLDPVEVPVKTFFHGWVQLGDEIVGGTATFTRITETLALELLSAFGMLERAA